MKVHTCGAKFSAKFDLGVNLGRSAYLPQQVLCS